MESKNRKERQDMKEGCWEENEVVNAEGSKEEVRKSNEVVRGERTRQERRMYGRKGGGKRMEWKEGMRW